MSFKTSTFQYFNDFNVLKITALKNTLKRILFPPNPSRWFFLWLWFFFRLFPHTREHSRRALSLCSSLASYSAQQTRAAVASLDSQLVSDTQETTVCCLSPLTAPQPGSGLQAVTWANDRT